MTLFGTTFLFPLGLLFLPVMVVIGWWLSRRPVVDMVEARVQEQGSWWQFKALVVYRVIFWICICLITLLLASPHARTDIRDIQYEGIDIMVVLDVSESMQASDFDPNRMEGAKRVVTDFLSQNQGNRIGTILFSGQPFLFAPLTHDTDFLIEQVAAISTDSIREEYLAQSGTAVGDAILLAGKHITDYSDPDRDAIIILVTDGEANQGVDPLVAAAYLADKDIPVYTIGMGDPEGNWQNIRQGSLVQQVFLRLDEETLMTVAQQTGGQYYLASDETRLAEIFDELASQTTSTITEERITQYDSRFLPILRPLFGCLIILLVLQVLYPRLRPV